MTTISKPTYEFDLPFQRKIVALLLRDPIFFSKSQYLLKSEYFQNEIDALLVHILLSYSTKYKKAPTRLILNEIIKRQFKDKKIRKETIPEISEALKEMYSADLSDSEFVLEEITTFAKHQAIQEALIESVGALDKKDFVKIQNLLHSALIVGQNEAVKGYDYKAMVASRTDKRVMMGSTAFVPDGISTGYKEIDDFLYHKGWGRKELTVLMGAAKAGKSMSLGDFGMNASLLGYNVLYVTLEVAADIIADRCDAKITKTAMKSLKDAPFSIQAKLEIALKKAGYFIIHEYPSGTFKASQLKRLLEDYRGQGISFDLVIVDYADIMTSENRQDDRIQESRNVYIDLRGIASEYNVALLTATQTNREGAKAALVKSEHVAEDFNKIRTADLIISINALAEEVKAGECRLYFAASRNQESGVTFVVKQDRSSMQFITKILRQE